MPLKLTRAAGERIFIGPDVMVEFVGLNQQGEAILSIDAPREIKVYREELAQQMAAEVECQNKVNRKASRHGKR